MGSTSDRWYYNSNQVSIDEAEREREKKRRRLAAEQASIEALEAKIGARIDWSQNSHEYWRNIKRQAQGVPGPVFAAVKKFRGQRKVADLAYQVENRYNPCTRYGQDIADKLWGALNTAMADEGCVDNHRFAACDDRAARLHYRRQAEGGCCGNFDDVVTIGGRKYMIGCNYGH